ncbi:MAG: carbohydrate kinase family protein [Anaerolineales bacterium]|nr:carbohydrate kinase family protein [Anaerolineales bacterium]
MNQFFTSTPEAPVLVIGGSGVDIIGQVKGELHRNTSNPARIRSSFGGIARNVAENLARLGHAVKLITVVGRDQAGDEMLRQLAEAGVDTSSVLRTPEHSTGFYLGVVKADGVMQFALDDMRAIAALTPSYLRERNELFKEAALVFVDANLSADTLRTTMSLARRAKVPVCADPTSITLANRLRPYLNRLHLITPNSNEAAIFCEQPFEAAKSQQAITVAKYLVGQGVGIVLITLAEFGVVYASSETSGHIPALRTKVVDPTGAGDALNSTVIFALLNGLSLDEAVRLGVSAASLTLRHPGSVLPSLSLELLYDQLVI